MSRCRECGGEVRGTIIREHREDLLGVPVILMNSAVREVCVACRKEHAIVIPDMAGLIAAVAVTRAMKPWKLLGIDIRFMRKAIGLSGKVLAELLEVAPATVSRWENGKEVIGPTSEKLLRFVTAKLLEDKALAVDCDLRQILQMRIQSARLVNETLGNDDRMIFERVKVKIVNHKTSPQWDHADAA